MITATRFLFVIIVLLAVSSCHKEEKIRQKLAGTWLVKSIEYSYFTSNSMDSSRTEDDAGVLLLYDLGITNYNNCEYKFDKAAPLSIYDVANNASGLDPQHGVCFWEAGPTSTDRLTLWSDATGVDMFTLYTVQKVKREKMVLSYVRTDTDGNMIYKETWNCESY